MTGAGQRKQGGGRGRREGRRGRGREGEGIFQEHSIMLHRGTTRMSSMPGMQRDDAAVYLLYLHDVCHALGDEGFSTLAC